MPAEDPGELVDVPADAVVIRFRPWASESVWASACKEYRRIGRYRLSVFADGRRGEETQEEVIDRLLRATEIRIDPGKNKKYSLCTSAEKLTDLGYTFWKDMDDDGELDEHYSVDLGIEATPNDVERFLGVFHPAEERRQS
jgi:hypothetical protein